MDAQAPRYARRKGETVDFEHDNAVMQGKGGQLPSGEQPGQWRTPIGSSLEHVRGRRLFLGDELAKLSEQCSAPHSTARNAINNISTRSEFSALGSGNALSGAL